LHEAGGGGEKEEFVCCWFLQALLLVPRMQIFLSNKTNGACFPNRDYTRESFFARAAWCHMRKFMALVGRGFGKFRYFL